MAEEGRGLTGPLARLRARLALERRVARNPVAALRLKLRQVRSGPREGRSPLLCVVTGLPHTGTTLLSQLLNAHPRVAAGFECGVLLSDIVDYPRTQPFYDWLPHRGLGWAVRPEDRDGLCDAVDFDDYYRRLNRVKGQRHDDPHLRQVFETSDLLFDKTPRYVFRLTSIMGRVAAPFLVTVKEPLETLASATKRGQDLDEVMQRYALALRQIDAAMARYPDRLMVVRYRSLAEETDRVMAAVKAHVGLGDAVELTLAAYRARMGHVLEESDGPIRTDRIAYVPPGPPTPDQARLIDRIERHHGARLDRIRDAAI